MLGKNALIAVALLCSCGTDYTQPSTFQPEPPAVYVAKVKNILVGLPPTDDEIAQVAKDPKALGALVDSWMAMPEYQAKMMVFFELAFQQTQITTANLIDLVPPNGTGNGRALPLLVQNMRESFARTALELVSEGRPLTDAFATHQLMMTPALMELYAFLDTRRVDDNAKITDQFGKANPTLSITVETSGGPIPITDSVNPASPNYMHFYSPDLPGLMFPTNAACNGLDPVTAPAGALALHALLYGEVPAHQAPTGNCPARATAMSVQVLPTDFTAWKMVTLRAPMAGEQRTVFYDLPSLRSASELVLGTPHVGFFTTPAFEMNWPTNQSNQMRVTLNQSLIVATGMMIDGQDMTVPSSTPGLDPAHDTPGACIGCHQLLDPTRSILSSTYSWFYYPQTDTSLTAQPGLFAFQGVVQPMHNIDDFANLLATHPLVAQGWGQKLCYYVNSAACSPDDPEFKRILGDFTSANLSWNTLVRDLMTSPLTTYTDETLTSKTNGEVIAVARRDHLCAALNNRLGFVDVCQLDSTLKRAKVSTIATIISGMPSDGYGRGATAPVLPNEPTLFYRAGLENICETVATMVIDGAPDPNQPGLKSWSSGQPDAAIADFVSIVMAMPGSDPRAPQVTQILKDHFTAAQQSGAAATDALRSTFVAACLSPSFIGIGM